MVVFEEGDGEGRVRLDGRRRVEVVAEELLDEVSGFSSAVATAEVEQDGVTAVDVDDAKIAPGWDRVCANRAVMVTQLDSQASVVQGAHLEHFPCPSLA